MIDLSWGLLLLRGSGVYLASLRSAVIMEGRGRNGGGGGMGEFIGFETPSHATLILLLIVTFHHHPQC